MATETSEVPGAVDPGVAPAGQTGTARDTGRGDGKGNGDGPHMGGGSDNATPPPPPPPPAPPQFILYLQGPEYAQTLRQLTLWAHHVLLPVYGREITSTAPWCSRWWEHPEAVAQFHGLWLAWADLTGPGSGMSGPANWHRDYLGPVMTSLRDPMGPFAGCKPGGHRAKEVPPVDAKDPFGPPPGSPPAPAPA